MSPTETVAAYYQAFNDGDVQKMLSFLAQDIRHEPNEGTPRIGKALFLDFIYKMNACYVEQLQEVVIFEGNRPGRIAAEFTAHGKYIKSDLGLPEAKGQTYILPAGAFLEVRDGLITRVTTYYNLDHWISLITSSDAQMSAH